MNSLILDRFNKQPLHLRFIWKTLTACGWGFWIYLWLPLIAPIGIYHGIYHGISSAESHWQQLTTTLMGHFSTVCILISIFMVWALLQRFGRAGEYKDHQKNQLKSVDSIRPSVLTEQNFAKWRQMRRIVAIHDEKTGQILKVERR